ncbi:uncharacterized protein PRCAT00003831001 [Priceomyces carsonii]|uniref:uncharacterized protein n=1 Tax=Priceomyces carsonii TaxID=28549 RepID=UPI002ED9CDD7|nr:unnamed protein product [Priceomyces carsonii]
MGVFNIFKKGFDADEFDKELTLLSQTISSSQDKIYRLRRKSKAIKWYLIKHTIVLYILVIAYCYAKVSKNEVYGTRFQRFVRAQSRKLLGILIGLPILSFVLVKLLQLVFNILIESQERGLKNMRRKHSLKIEELKKVTNFNTANELLTKYGDDGENHPHQAAQGTKNEDVHLTELQHMNPQDMGLNLDFGPIQQPTTPTSPTSQSIQQLPNSAQSISSPVGRTPQRSFQDRILDLLIGSDNNESVETRYALICNRCFTHNGLAPPGCKDPLTVKYICFRCGALNGSEKINDDICTDNLQTPKPRNNMNEGISGVLAEPHLNTTTEKENESHEVSGSSERDLKSDKERDNSSEVEDRPQKDDSSEKPDKVESSE